MQLNIFTGNSRYACSMSTDEINQALQHARALTAMSPEMATARPLTLFIGECLTELWRREEAEPGERPVTELSRKELRDLIAHAAALRLLEPRRQIQDCMLNCMLAAASELESRSKTKGIHMARVVDCLTGGRQDGLPA